MINDIKELEKLLKLCRKQGVTEIEVVGAKLKLGDLPEKEVQESDPSKALDELVGMEAIDPEFGVPKMAFLSASSMDEQ